MEQAKDILEVVALGLAVAVQTLLVVRLLPPRPPRRKSRKTSEQNNAEAQVGQVTE